MYTLAAVSATILSAIALAVFIPAFSEKVPSSVASPDATVSLESVALVAVRSLAKMLIVRPVVVSPRVDIPVRSISVISSFPVIVKDAILLEEIVVFNNEALFVTS